MSPEPHSQNFGTFEKGAPHLNFPDPTPCVNDRDDLLNFFYVTLSQKFKYDPVYEFCTLEITLLSKHLASNIICLPIDTNF